MNKLLTLLLCFLSALPALHAQTLEELKAEKAEKQSQISALQGELNGIQAKIEEFPGWYFGSYGTIGINFNQFDNWFSKKKPNTSSSNIGFSLNAFANKKAEKYFWNNSGGLNLGWVKFDDKDDPDDNPDFEQSADVINITSLFGYKVAPKFAISALSEYRSTILSNFNNPGYLDFGVGGTWTPINDLVVVIHPLNFNIVFSKDDLDFESSLGTKLVADYGKSLPMGVSWRSKLSAFLSYKSSDFSNWTWTNSFGLTVLKGVGVGLEFGLRSNQQEADNYEAQRLMEDPNFGPIENPLQSYWLLGLTYNL